MTRNGIDFTKKRKRTKQPGMVIDHCPKCGRKGQRIDVAPPGAKGWIEFIHKGYVNENGMMSITDHCAVSKETGSL